VSLRDRLRGRDVAVLGAVGAALALAVAAALFTRFSIDGNLSRDESIYAYAGQQLAAGVPLYDSIFDPKTPLAGALAGLGVAIAKAVGADEVHAIRVVFLLCGCLAVVAVYLLALSLWRSVVAGLAAAVTLASFDGFAADAIAGPDAKTPGVLVAALSMLAMATRRWFWAGLCGSAAFLVWQPLGVYAAVAVVAAPLVTPSPGRGRAAGGAAAGAALPFAVAGAYFALAGSLSQAWQAALVFPFTGVRRAPQPFEDRLRLIRDTVATDYGHTRLLFWLGLAALLALVVARLVGPTRDLRHPLVYAVAPTLAVLVAWSLHDFQGYPDVFPLLPYPALGVGGAVALLVRPRAPALRGAATAVALAAVAALGVLTWSWYTDAEPRGRSLTDQRADAAALERLVGARRLYALGDPTPLVLTRRRNPSRFVYLGSGVGPWMLERTPGGLRGWEARLRRSRPAAIVLHAWRSPVARKVRAWLPSWTRRRRIGTWNVYVPRTRAAPARRRAARERPATVTGA
jgi:hypothetical protein